MEKAYNYLSDDCKQVLYPSINNFIDGYNSKNFKEDKSYSYKLWNGNTYKIELRQNILSTGMYSDSAYIEDYYTIVGNKINIDGFIKREKIEKSVTKQGLKIKIDTFDFYKDYTICNLQIYNGTENKFYIDYEEEDSIYMENNYETKYEAFLYEMQKEDMEISKKQNKNIEIKFNCVYNEQLNLSKVIFKNIKNNENDKKIQIEINL